MSCRPSIGKYVTAATLNLHAMDPREREAREAKERQRKQLLDRAYDQVVAKQLEKLGSKKTFTGEHWCFFRRFMLLMDTYPQ